VKYVLDANAAIAALNDVGDMRARLGLHGENRATLEAKGIVKSDFDLVIACTALEQEAILVTSDRGLLDNSIPGLRAENWVE
jgi:predicted nucleic acid-binding protein